MYILVKAPSNVNASLKAVLKAASLVYGLIITIGESAFVLTGLCGSKDDELILGGNCGRLKLSVIVSTLLLATYVVLLAEIVTTLPAPQFAIM